MRAAPPSWNFSRILANFIELQETHGLISEITAVLCAQLMAVLRDFGEHLGFGGTDIANRSTGRQARASRQSCDPEADWDLFGSGHAGLGKPY